MRRGIWMAGLALAGALAGYFLVERAHRHIDSGTPKPQAVEAVPPPAIAMPAQGIPARQVLALLRDAADHGNVEAACRVGTEMTRCAQLRVYLNDIARSEARMQSVAPDERRKISTSIEELRAKLRTDTAICEGVGDRDIDDAWRYLLKAALGGSTEAMTQFAVAPPLSREPPVSSIEGWTAYKEHASRFLEQAIRRGSVRALHFGWFSAMSGMNAGGYAARDPYAALVYATALRGLVDATTSEQVDAMIPELEKELGARAAQARREGEALRAARFSGATRQVVSTGAGRVRPAQCSSQD
jgi:hypothetical protein